MEDNMSRKRTPQPSNTSSDNQDSTAATATVESEAAAQTAEPVSAPPVAPPQESFVERLQRERGQRRPESRIPDPFGIASDNAAGVHLFENRQARLMVIKFDEKPSEDVLNRLKDSGFRWNPRDKVWVNPIHPENARAVRIEAERTYQAVSSMIREEKGIGSSPDIPF
jgi:hypothetical protein